MVIFSFFLYIFSDREFIAVWGSYLLLENRKFMLVSVYFIVGEKYNLFLE